MKTLFDIVLANRQGKERGLYSVCCAQPHIIEAAMCQSKLDNSIVLIEATANQVNQFGGYTGMEPADFVEFIEAIARRLSFPMDKVILGGDHLGPVCWVNEPFESAKVKSEALIAAYVKAGFKKIHLDTSMPCADDPLELTDEVVAERAAHLCKVAEKTAINTFGYSDISYVVGTEVPPPGGAKEEINTLEVTPKLRVAKTIECHQLAFNEQNLQLAWERVIALVVQPGVEFDHTQVFDFDNSKVTELSSYIQTVPNIVFEAHSTDYQKPQAYIDLVNSHFAILKVGPQLSFAMREAVFALSHIEEQLFSIEHRSNIRDVFETEMISNPKYWSKFYGEEVVNTKLLRKFSYSDRIRYYWNTAAVELALAKLLSNFEHQAIPLPLISQYLPEQYHQIRDGKLNADANSLIVSKIQSIIKLYANACN